MNELHLHLHECRFADVRPRRVSSPRTLPCARTTTSVEYCKIPSKRGECSPSAGGEGRHPRTLFPWPSGVVFAESACFLTVLAFVSVNGHTLAQEAKPRPITPRGEFSA